jgi:surface antigen
VARPDFVVAADESVVAAPVVPEVAAVTAATPVVSIPVETGPVPVAASYAAPVRRRVVAPEELMREDAKEVERRRRRRAGKPVRDESTARSLRQRITATGTMVVVGGIFASLTLPAYAFPDQAGVQSAAKQTASQTLSVADGQVAPTTRDAFGVTSAADLKTQYANALRQKNMQAYLNSGARALGDDYPWATELTRGEGGGLSPLRYYYRECVDFVAWRLNRDAGSTTAPYKWDWSTLTPGNGNASGWKSAWADHGWAMGTTPQVGSVAWFGGQNHVSYVSGVLGDGSVVLEEYNWNNNHIYDQRIVQASDVSMFLYAPPK